MSPKTPPITAIYRPTHELKPNPKNPRVHSAQQIRLLVQSIKAVGFNVPIVIDSAGTIIAGHARHLAAQKMALTEVPTICLDHLSEHQIRAFMIADNKLCEIAQWNDELLAEQFQILAAADLNFSLEVTGFTMGEIDLRIEGLSPAANNKDDPADQVPLLPAGPPVTQLGDRWVLGKHRLFCGNALEEADYEALMNGAQAAMVFTDPPYNVKIDGHVGGLGAIRHREFAMASGEMTKTEFLSFLTSTCTMLTRYSTDGSMHFICMDWRSIWELLEAGNSAYTELKNICVWVKDNGGMGSLYRSQHELIAVFKNGKAPHRNNVELGKHGRYRTNVWQYAGANSFARKGDEGNLLAMHPTVKPVAMVVDAILDCSARGDIILDPYIGSGTTLMASERAGRICYGMELDPLYIDATIRRFQAYTGQLARHASSGRSFNEIASEVEAGHVK